ncbi:MAG: RNA methyltransferase [Candidatus Margulisiibacteriota bacterium]
MEWEYKTITSADNPLIKMIAGLNDKKNRDKEGLFYIEGRFNLEEALKNSIAIKYVLFTEEGLLNELPASAAFKNAELVLINPQLLKKISRVDSPHGIIAVAEKPCINEDDLPLGKNPLIVIGDNIRDPGNVGTIIRSADAANADAVVLSSNSADVFNPKVVRSTGGSIFHLPVVNGCDLKSFIKRVKKNKGIRIIGASAKGKTDHTKVDFTLPSAIIIGNEALGISKEIEALCDETAAIPIPGKAESLNAAVSCSILLYEAVRQRCSKK